MLVVMTGLVLIAVGLVGAANAFRLVDVAARRWPRVATRGDVADFVSSSFLLRFVSLLLLVAGVALVLSRF